VVPHKLIDNALLLHYPPLLLYLGLMVHAAPRFIRTSAGCISGGCIPDTSIVAGDMQSNSWARALVHSVLQRAHDAIGPTAIRSPNVMINQYVDDLAQRAQEPTQAGLISTMVSAAVVLREGLHTLDLTISVSKMGLTASSDALAAALSRALCEVGIEVQPSSYVRDLGLTAASGKKRRVTVINHRLKKTGRRTQQAARLHRWSGKRAGKLVKGSLYPAATFGLEATGASPSTIAKLRAAAARLSRYAGPGGCATTLIALEHGMAWDPAIRVPRTILSSWLDLWRGLKPKEQALARAVWDKHKIKFQAYNGTHRWNMVSGPIATAVATLMDLGWNPDRPDRWISPGGDTWRVTRGAGPANVLDELSRSAEAKAWSRASSHYHGVGLEHGGDLVGLKRQLATPQARSS